MHDICMPFFIPPDSLIDYETLAFPRKRFKSGETIYLAGDVFSSLYAIRSGFIKLQFEDRHGRGQVVGFFMMGEVIGFDGINTNKYTCTAYALEDSEVCKISPDKIESLSISIPELKSHCMRLMSQEIIRENNVIMILGTMNADERVAAFLVNLSMRFSARGYSSTEYTLRMKREEIGSYLGLTVESVSRVLKRFKNKGLIGVKNKYIHILEIAGLQKIITSFNDE